MVAGNSWVLRLRWDVVDVSLFKVLADGHQCIRGAFNGSKLSLSLQRSEIEWLGRRFCCCFYTQLFQLDMDLLHFTFGRTLRSSFFVFTWTVSTRVDLIHGGRQFIASTIHARGVGRGAVGVGDHGRSYDKWRFLIWHYIDIFPEEQVPHLTTRPNGIQRLLWFTVLV